MVGTSHRTHGREGSEASTSRAVWQHAEQNLPHFPIPPGGGEARAPNHKPSAWSPITHEQRIIRELRRGMPGAGVSVSGDRFSPHIQGWLHSAARPRPRVREGRHVSMEPIEGVICTECPLSQDHACACAPCWPQCFSPAARAHSHHL